MVKLADPRDEPVAADLFLKLAHYPTLIAYSWEVQCGHRAAATGICIAQNGQLLVDAAGAAAGPCTRATIRTTRNTQAATIRKVTA
jgi:hypothetical protein